MKPIVSLESRRDHLLMAASTCDSPSDTARGPPLGGFRFLGQFLAEDQICAEEMARRGHPVIVSGCLIDNVLGRRTFGEFAGRHLRWARLRCHVNLAGYLGEILLNPVFLALLGVLVLRSADSVLVAGLALTRMSLIDASTERALGLRRPVWVYPLLELALSVVRGALWFVPLFSRTVVWRGNVLTLSARSRIELKTRVERARNRGSLTRMVALGAHGRRVPRRAPDTRPRETVRERSAPTGSPGVPRRGAGGQRERCRCGHLQTGRRPAVAFRVTGISRPVACAIPSAA